MHIKDPRVTFSESDIALLKTIRYAISLLPDRVELDPRNDDESDLLYGWAYYGMLTIALGHIYQLEVGVVIDAHASDLQPRNSIDNLTFCLITKDGSAIIVALPGTFGGPGMFHETAGEHSSMLFTTVATAYDTEDLPYWYRRGTADLIEAIKFRMELAHNFPPTPPRFGDQDQPI